MIKERSRLSYYSPSGKARLRMIKRYDVIIDTHPDLSKFNFGSKTRALAYLKSITIKGQ